MVVYSLFNSVVLDLLLLHLLLVTGAAVVTVCIYYYVQRDDGGQTTEDTEDTTVPEDPVYEQTTEPALVRHTEVVQDQMMECEREQEAHSILQNKYQEMKKTLMNKELLKEYKQEQEAHSIHQAEINESITHLEEENIEMKRTLIDQVELMKVTLAEAEGQHQNNVQTITQQEEENSDLTETVEALRDTVETLGNIIFQSSKKHNNLTNERETHSIVQSEVNEMKIITQLEEQNSEMKKTLIHKEELHKVAVAEAEEKYQKDVETITQLEEENSDLTEKLEVLKETVEELGNVLFETNRVCDLLINEREAHSILQSENNEMKETIIQLEEQNSDMKKTITQLEKDNSDLLQKVEILSDTVKELGKELIVTHLQCDELTDVSDKCLALISPISNMRTD